MTTKNAQDPLIGTRLGDYLIQELLGRGGMARVYRGLDENLGRAAAVKVLEIHANDAEDERIIERFKLEARAIASFEHPNIVSIYQYGETERLFFIAMKLVQGSTLTQLLRQARREGRYLPPEKILQITYDVCSALDYAHERGIIHRDIKPSNILFDANANDRAILTDFGLAMQLGGTSTLGTAFGTPRYISPEQAVSSQNAVPQSDIYSLGVVLFEMLTNQVPFQDESPMSVALYHITSEPPRPSSINPHIPPEVEAVILRALEKEPRRRYATAGQLYEALRDAYVSAEVELPTPLVPPAPSWPSKEDAVESPARPARAAPPPRSKRPSPARPGPRPGPQGSRLRTLWPALAAIAVVAILGILAVGGSPPEAGGAPTTAVTQGGGLGGTPAEDAVLVELIYDEHRFALHNLHNAEIYVDRMAIEWDENGQRRSYPGTRFSSPIPAGDCSWIRLLSDARREPPRECPTPVHDLRTLPDASEMFWVARNGSHDSFRVLVNGQLVQTCPLEAGRCLLALPGS